MKRQERESIRISLANQNRQPRPFENFTTDEKRIKGRYYSVKNEGHEIYCEDVPKTWAATPILIREGKERLAAIRKAMPRGAWTITLEQELYQSAGTIGAQCGVYEKMDVETGEVIS